MRIKKKKMITIIKAEKLLYRGRRKSLLYINTGRGTGNLVKLQMSFLKQNR